LSIPFSASIRAAVLGGLTWVMLKVVRYEEAISHFQSSVVLDPGLLNARLYLATAYAQQYIPGVDSEENNHMAEQAIEQFKRVLDVRPSRDLQISSLKGIASLYLNMHKLDLAKGVPEESDGT
jgi:tetratricopeptide (TPR) repeat protein